MMKTLFFCLFLFAIVYGVSDGTTSTKAKMCHTSNSCNTLPAPCYTCQTNNSCRYGDMDAAFDCVVLPEAECTGPREVVKLFQCRYCFLTSSEEHWCTQTNRTCNVYSSPPQLVKARCQTNADVFCLGNRTFTKMVLCNWTSGYSWVTSIVLSMFLGGFGVDRFYLGYWREGLGKFFSFGGIGVWTIIDFFLIATGYLTPYDGSLYVWWRCPQLCNECKYKNSCFIFGWVSLRWMTCAVTKRIDLLAWIHNCWSFDSFLWPQIGVESCLDYGLNQVFIADWWLDLYFFTCWPACCS